METPNLPKKKALTEEQKADADRLLALWEAWQDARKLRGDSYISQGKFADTHGLGTQGNLWQYTHGKTPLNIRAAVAFAEGLGCKIEDFSPTLAAQADEIGSHVAPKPSPFASLIRPERPSTPFRPGPSTHTEVMDAFHTALPRELWGYLEKTIALDGAEIKIDYLSPAVAAELVIVRDGLTLKSSSAATLILQLVQRATPLAQPHLIVVSIGAPRVLPKVVQITCRLMGITVHKVGSGEAAAHLLYELECGQEMEEPLD